MSFERRQKMPTVKEIKEEMPFPEDIKEEKRKRDKEITDIFLRKNNKFILIIGPCSADKEDAVFEYVTRLRKLQDKVYEKIMLIPRIYTNKPRTTGEGYKGMGHQPDPSEGPNLVEGLKAIRKMHLKLLRETSLSGADEVLYPDNSPYLDELVSYITIGARSVENQQHRLTASGFDAPVGMKNPTSGDLTVLLNSIYAAQNSHVFVYNGWEVKTSGNPLAHCILRGSTNQYGQKIPNYHYEEMVGFAETYQKKGVLNATIIVDTNHDNSGKNYKEQPRIAMSVLDSMKKSAMLKNMVKGFMIESYLEEGSQKIDGGVFGKSITDPCLGWEETEKLIFDIADRIT